jgi:hypothetical protein
MAFAARTEWDVRTTGDDSNGGGFNTISSGTDFSVQDAPQVTYTDLTIVGVDTDISSSANPFTGVHVGNILNVTGGSGFIVQRVQIVSVAAGVATCDKAVGTIASVGGAGKLGGGLATIGAANTLVVNGNIIHVKAGTYTHTATTTIARPIVLIGYNAAHYDYGTKPLITTATNSTVLMTITTATVAGSAMQTTFDNISFSNTAGTRARAINGANGEWNYSALKNCIFDGFTSIYDGGVSNRPENWYVENCEFNNCSATAWFIQSCNLWLYGSKIRTTGADAIRYQSNKVIISVVKSVIASTTGKAIATPNNAAAVIYLIDSAIFAASSDGVQVNQGGSFPSFLMMENSIIYDTGGFGVNYDAVQNGVKSLGRNNAFGDTTSGARNNVEAGVGEITLSADPFNNAASGDFTLNTTSGGGVLLRELGFPGVSAIGTGYADVGPLQHEDTGGGGSGILYVPNMEGT